MNMYNSLFSRNCMLNEQVARQIFDILPEQGPIVIIMDRDGHFWPSDSGRFAKLDITEAFLKELCGKIDDGIEPLMTQSEDHSIVATQLATDMTNCGYVVMVLPQYSPESTLVNIDLIEIVAGVLVEVQFLLDAGVLQGLGKALALRVGHHLVGIRVRNQAR